MRCLHCRYESSAKLARCPGCRRFGTFKRVHSLADVAALDLERISTGQPALDGILGGGFVRGCTYRLSGTPGAGKSTASLAWVEAAGGLYETSEELLAAIATRARRLGLDLGAFKAAEARTIEDVIGDLDEFDGPLVVVDSLQRLASSSVSGPAGSIAQVQHAVSRLTRAAQDHNVAIVYLAHVTKSGETAGPNGADHDCDGLLFMRREETGAGEITIEKHRHGESFVSVCFWHEENGIHYGDETDLHDHLSARGDVRDDLRLQEEEALDAEEEGHEEAHHAEEDQWEEEALDDTERESGLEEEAHHAEGLEEEADEAEGHAPVSAAPRRTGPVQAEAVTS